MLGEEPEEGISLAESTDDANTLTTVVIASGGVDVRIAVHWAYRPWTHRFEVLFIPETNVAFVGAGTLSAIIDVGARHVIEEKSVDLFWAFHLEAEYVIELGELDCFLYHRDGRRIASVPVDPPYETEWTERGVRFQSPNYGEHWLLYPDSRV